MKAQNIVDKYNRLSLPDRVFLNGKEYKGVAVFINGYNGHKATGDDGILAAIIESSAFNPVTKLPNYLTDAKGKGFRAKSRRGIAVSF